MTARQLNAFGGTFVFFATHSPTLKNPNEPPSNRTKTSVNIDRRATTERTPAHNSTYKKLAVQWLNEAFPMNRDKLCPEIRDFVVADSLVLLNRQLLVASNRLGVMLNDTFTSLNRKRYETKF
jgi:hypothetical protein